MMRLLACLAVVVGQLGLAYGQSSEELVNQCDAVLHLASTDYDVVAELADEIRRRGVDTNDRELEVRGLIRMVYANLVFGQWSPEWQEWHQRAIRLGQALPDPCIGRADLLIHNGMLRATYLGEPKEGIEGLRQAVAIGKTLGDDKLLGNAFRQLGFALQLEGQTVNSLENLTIGALFSRRAGDTLAEYMTLERLIRNLRSQGLNTEQHEARAKLLARELGLKASILRDESTLVAEAIEGLQNVEQLYEKPASEFASELRTAAAFAGYLIKHYERQHEWEKLEQYLPCAEQIAELQQDESSQREFKLYRAASLAREGRTEEAEKLAKDFFVFYEGLGNAATLRRNHEWMAQHYEVGRDMPRAVASIRNASRYNAWDDLGRSINTSAQSYFENEIKTRRLRDVIHQREGSLTRTRLVLVAIPLLGVFLWLWHSARSHQNSKNQLEELVDQQTDSLRTAKENAERQNIAKTEFVARINHELRNPLTAIVACSDMLCDDNTTSETDRRLAKETLQACTQNLLDSIDEVLDFTRIEAGKLEFQPNEFAPVDLLASVRKIVETRVDECVDVMVSIADDVPLRMVTDESKLRQVLCNLGLNSARHTDHGQITFSCDVDSDGTNELVVVVQDSGEGIDHDLLEDIFERYATTAQHSGSGLGLYICRAFTNCLGGSIACDSKSGTGTTMTVRVPFVGADRPDEALTDDGFKATSGFRILVVDDEPANRRVIARVAEKIGYDASQAAGWSEVESIIISKTIDVVLLDLRLPGVDGFEIASRIRAMRLAKQPFIVAMTGDATNATRERTEKAGFDAFFPKPFNKDRLVAAIESAKRQVTVAS